MKSYSISYRVYYEDTDAAGVMYHANYLKFAERARTEWLRTLGFSQHSLMTEEKIIFPVYKLSIDFIAPAKLDDLLEILVEVEQIKNVSMKIYQKISCQGKLLAELEVWIASCNLEKKPVKFPKGLLEKIKTPLLKPKGFFWHSRPEQTRIGVTLDVEKLKRQHLAGCNLQKTSSLS